MPEAAAYCAWKYPDGGRLPTEEEWEAAARGPSARTYAWGSTWTPGAANVGTNAIARVGLHPLGRTPEGLEDMTGNVWEWTSSPFVSYGKAVTGMPAQFVIRGGGFNSIERAAAAFFRAGAAPVLQRDQLAVTGFRCAMSVP